MAVNNEGAIFGGQSAPSSLQMLSKIMPDVSDTLLKTLLKLVFDVITKKPLPPRALEQLSKSRNIENVEQLFGGLLILAQIILRQKPDTLKETELRLCLKNLKFTDDCSNEFVNTFYESKSQLYLARSLRDNSYYLKIKKLDWRIDITISSSSLSKAFDTVIILQIIFTNGDRQSFEISISKFHLLRLYVASLLKEFQDVDKKNNPKT